MKAHILLVFLSLSMMLAAQPGSGKRQGAVKERIRAQRVAFITERLALTSEEAQRFWPVYHEFTDQMESVKKAQRENRNATNDKLSAMSDKEVEKSLQDELSYQQQLVDLQRKYQMELAKTIPMKKVAMLYKAERDFKIALLRKMRDAGQKPPPDDDF